MRHLYLFFLTKHVWQLCHFVYSNMKITEVTLIANLWRCTVVFFSFPILLLDLIFFDTSHINLASMSGHYIPLSLETVFNCPFIVSCPCSQPDRHILYIQFIVMKTRIIMMPTLSSGYWKLRVVMIPTLFSLVAPQVVIMTTCGATSGNKVGIVTTLDYDNLRCYQWQQSWHCDNSRFSVETQGLLVESNHLDPCMNKTYLDPWIDDHVKFSVLVTFLCLQL